MQIKLDGLTKLCQERYEMRFRALEKSVPNQIKAYFPDTDLRYGYDGLAVMAKKEGINFNELKAGEMVLFTNRSKTFIKLVTCGEIVVTQRAPKNMRFIYSAIMMIPKFFNGKQLDAKGAIERAIRADYDSWRQKKGLPAPN